MNHECYIGILNTRDYSTMVTLGELKNHIEAENELKAFYQSDWMFQEVASRMKVWSLNDYCDRRKSTDLTRFMYCPACGNKIDWKAMKG